MLASLLGLSSQAQADTSDNTLWLTLGVSQNSHSVSTAQLSAGFDDAGGELLDYDNSAQGFEFGLKYILDNHWVFTAGYRNLGELDNSWRVDTLDSQQALTELQAVMPVIGDGVYAGVGYRQPFAERYYADILVEAQKWDQEFTTRTATLDPIVTERSGTTAVIGLGLGMNVTKGLSLSLNAKRFKFDDDSVNSLSLNVEWQFGDLLFRSSPSSTYKKPVSAELPAATVRQVAEPVALVQVETIETTETTDVTDTIDAIEVVEPIDQANHELVSQEKTFVDSISSETKSKKIYFRSESTYLNQADIAIIRSVLAKYKAGDKIGLTGRADGSAINDAKTSPMQRFNTKLARERAENVKQVLVESGVPESDIIIEVILSFEFDRFSRSVDINLH